jgi:NhaP-type Na+/H+ or K+/H+ antiporter
MISKLSNSENIYTSSIDYWSNISAKNFILYLFPPLIYHASLNINYHIFKKAFWLILFLSFFGVFVNASLISLFVYGSNWDINNKYALLLGTILGAIDPIAITSILPELTLSEKLINLIESESLLNDEFSICLFYLVVDLLFTDKNSTILFIGALRILFGSILIGIILSLIKIYFLRRVFHSLTSQISLSIAFCYLSYFIAEKTILDTSGILAVVVMGICMSSFGKTRINPDNISFFMKFWDILSEYSNIVIFSLSGIIISDKIDFTNIIGRDYLYLICLYLFINVIRFLTCIICYPLLKKNILNYDYIDFFIIASSGIRGEISLVLSLIVSSYDNIPILIRNKILFFVSGIVCLSISINSNIIKQIIKYYHRDMILMDSKQLANINKHIQDEANLYLEKICDSDNHLTKVDFEKVRTNLFENINNEEIIIQELYIDILSKKLFLTSLKKNIWQLFRNHILHYDVVMKLIDITDNNLDNLDNNWYDYLNDYCNEEHINTFWIYILGNIPILKKLKDYIIFHRVEYNYNFIWGYILSLRETQEKMKEIIEDEKIIDIINKQVTIVLERSYKYMSFLERHYDIILSKIETKQMTLLVISKQKSHLHYLKKNGEISDRIYDKLLMKFGQKEDIIKHN